VIKFLAQKMNDDRAIDLGQPLQPNLGAFGTIANFIGHVAEVVEREPFVTSLRPRNQVIARTNKNEQLQFAEALAEVTVEHRRHG